MAPLKPRTQLSTHSVTNQPPPLEDYNLFETDTVLREAVTREGGTPHVAALTTYGARMGSAEAIAWGFEANRNPPELKLFDRYGQRIDEVNFHPAYHRLMELGLGSGFASTAWNANNAGHVAHAALLFMTAQTEQGVCCPMTMTYAAVPALKHGGEKASPWIEKILQGKYDPASKPASQKQGVTIGMAMTEKQGGSDVRANTTKAESNGDGTYTLNGHKWFCSAPMCDAFLTLAYTDKGLGCFLVPRWTGNGERNAMHIQRLKDKLGDRANASSEIEYHGAEAVLLGEEGRGVRTIIEMVHHTRLDCTVAPAAFMRQALVQALWHTSHRSAFQKKLVDQPLMARVLADLALESEAATQLAFRMAGGFDGTAASQTEALLSRIMTPIGKYWLNKRVVNFVYEAMECHGGAGYIEETMLPRLFRQSPLNSIWEGSGNVICLDVLRALTREPETFRILVEELMQARGTYHALDDAIERLTTNLGKITEPQARRWVEEAAIALQASLLVRHAPTAIADAFVSTRLGEDPWRTYGAYAGDIDTRAIIERTRSN